MSGIRVDTVSKSFPGTPRALDRVSLTVEPGEVFGVIGPNGAGKTTLMGCLLGLLTPDSGRITVDGRPPDDLAVRAATGYLPERPALERWMTGYRVLHYHCGLAGGTGAGVEAEVGRVLDRVGLDRASAGRPVKTYSRGMLQRLGLAQALIGRPRRLFLDEPTSGMDPAGMVLVRRIVEELRDDGTTVILNSHHMDQVERLCHRVAFVRQGRIEAVEVPEAGRGLARGLRVRLAGGAPPPDPDRLSALAEGAGAGFAGFRDGSLLFSVADDGVAARLLAGLTAAGEPVVEAVPEASGLERLFLDDEEVRR